MWVTNIYISLFDRRGWSSIDCVWVVQVPHLRGQNLYMCMSNIYLRKENIIRRLPILMIMAWAGLG